MEVRVTDLLDITVFDFWGLGMTYSGSRRDLVIETGLNLKTFQLVVQCGIQVLLLNLLKIEYSRIVASKWGLLNKLLSGLVGYDFWASCHFPESHLIFSIVIPEGFPDGSDSGQSACNAGDLVQSLGQEDPLEEGMATLSSIFMPGESQGQRSLEVYSLQSCRVGHD